MCHRILLIDFERNYAPERYADMIRSEGADFVRGFIGKLEEEDTLYKPDMRHILVHLHHLFRLG